MRATDFEFRHRFWLFLALFWAAFGCYAIDHVNAGAWLIDRLAPGLRDDPARQRLALQLLFGAGAVLAMLGSALRTWATGFLRSAIVHDHEVHTDQLVADGPYRFVRNPLYLGTQLLVTGTMMMTSRLGALVLFFGVLLFHLRLIGREEAALTAAQGESFQAYRARVPGFIPSLVPRVPGSGRKPNWADGFAAEAFFWVMSLAMLAFAISLEGRVMLYTSTAGVALYWVVTIAQRRRSAARG